MTYAINWDLESIFPGGSDSEKLKQRMAQLSKEIHAYHQAVTTWAPTSDTTDALVQLLQQAEIISNGFGQCSSFINALLSSNVNDSKAKILSSELYSKLPEYQLASTIFSKKLTEIADDTWAEQMATPELATVAFRLTEIRRDGNELLSEAEENIINTLKLDGLNAWSEHYDTIVASITIPFAQEDGTEIQLSAGQAFNKMMGDPDAAVRQELFEKWEQAWRAKADLFADTLNHLDGFRLSTQKLHGVENYLKEPLEYNRLKQETLDTMWATIQQNKQPIVDFLTRKAQLFGKEKMDWQDQDAPIILGEMQERTYSFDAAAEFIVANFQKFSPKMSEFAQLAFDNAWIEAEDRPGKRPGGYCTSLPETQESRIFMTYSNSVNEVATLAHELGHAFHSSVLWDLPSLNQDYAMNVAETASTFAELIVADATLKEAKTKEEKINLLDAKMQNAIAMFMNIHTRYIFENNFYQARQKGLVSSEQITEMMVAAQKESYLDSLGTYHPHFWAAKLHFFIDDVPFYNFPYTFGYLFSMGIYAYANQKGANFEDEYIALLRDTASMTTEDLAQKHLQVDLTKPDFWQAGIDMVLNDINEFMALTADYL
ncbi:M3 family oligoendopeptidase [Enterococcus saccharolyticus]|uniref:Oligoendopeptidase PepF/M3 family protein n=1 Tax=Enterococcus saccharolyticus subsp. saccharolyticus ATCC 43076 TaxID=1139996 RepID=S0P2I3_9ENTE|nr:M3 family oligoendopeptidase [Enterococcus saccharolyticus]EOT25971.1 oligoendopeptidase PepF/M3 family protein [Enterococcus saccharolyticus subsp. saccharolyticus ATCC 43076]EOT82661.1 oligoendopeptidase PepF/M3 family protein [Enterococcus saccharolyticus subsp. saccharolyticus ATCC 43076]OJG91031.1 oligoendopeptidase PepF/M3 family protein [Enterococcus saccharolyticus]